MHFSIIFLHLLRERHQVLLNIQDNFRKLRCMSMFQFPSYAWVGYGIRLHLIHFGDVINYTYMYNHSAKPFLLLSKLCFKTIRYSDSFIFLLNKLYSRKRSELLPFDRLTVPTRCLCCALFQLSLFIRFIFILDFFVFLRMIAWWPSAGKDTKCMQFQMQSKELDIPRLD